MYSFFNAPAENLDDTGTILTLSLLLRPLTPGSYRLALPEFAQMTGLDGSSVADLGSDQILGSFTVAQPGVTLSQAQNLGTAGALPITVPGSLDLADNPGAVQLYKFTVGSGHHWRLAAEVEAARRSTRPSRGSLIPTRARCLATDNLGLPNSPGDAYLYAGLNPGTRITSASLARGTCRTFPAVTTPWPALPARSRNPRQEARSLSASPSTRRTLPCGS